jgi:hypothetical protein
MNPKYYLVTTSYRGVFAGELIEDRGDVVVLAEARNCVYWDRETKGFLGLAATGPTQGCRIGPKVPSITLRGVTAIAECTLEARARWESAPWGA